MGKFVFLFEIFFKLLVIFLKIVFILFFEELCVRVKFDYFDNFFKIKDSIIFLLGMFLFVLRCD